MASQPIGDRQIDAMPTKELFIAMLTRDVALIPAIIDLADNCTDGARRLRGAKSWTGLEVVIRATAESFEISDNCGGMDTDTARKYAFRFGRDADAAINKGEVGRFGVGMKRGMFKLGRRFHVQSTTATTSFEVTIDVDEWAKKDEWQFEFDTDPVEGRSFPVSQRGTTLTVTKLHSQVKDRFADTEFIEELRQQLTSKLESSLLNGLAVQVNGHSLKAHVRELVSDAKLAPAKKSFKVSGSRDGRVRVELWCGLGKPESQKTARSESGWYVFCNGRMLLEADKTSATGWGEEDDESIPAYHPQYNDFRGFAYLDADDAADLPWNTTKTALDIDHPVYRRVRQEMILLARPVINFFNKRKEQNDTLRAAGDEGRGHLQSLFDVAHTKPIDQLTPRAVFTAPAAPAPRVASVLMRSISFKVAQLKADEVRKSLRAHSWKEVGEGVFDYYYVAECGDD